MDTTIEFCVLMVGSLGLATIFGSYLARLITFEKNPLVKTLAKVESGFYKVIGIDATKQMNWKEYFLALFVTNMVVVAFVILVLTLQNFLPMANGKQGLSVDLAFNTAISFITEPDLQHLAGDKQLSNLSQMVAITFPMFIAPATGIAAAFAFIRSFKRQNFGLGNFYIDFARIIITLLLPVSIVSSLILMVMGTPQTLESTIKTNTLENAVNKNSSAKNIQLIPIGPVASLESIKLLGNNGGGFFSANSGHPFENPTGLSNTYEMCLMLVIPLSFPIAYAKVIGKGRGIAILVTMLTGLGILIVITMTVNNGPLLLETRFGTFGTNLFNVVSLGTNTGAASSPLIAMPPNAIISFFLAMFIQAIPGPVGLGMMTMIIYVLLTLFIVGLLVGKTPEFMSMKISPIDIKLTVFIFLIHPAIILIPTVIALGTGNAQAIVGHHVKPLGYTQMLYEYTSAAANSGTDYFGTRANSPFWNWSTAIVMFLGRYLPMGLMLAIADSFTNKERKESIEPIKTQGPLFISVLITIIFLLTALTFFPFLILGPFSM